MLVLQKIISLPPYSRGFHLITAVIEKEFIDLKRIKTGILNIFIQHTSASLTINENADSTVRVDFENHFNRIFPEDADYQHDYEGSDDMPAHLKASVLGNSLNIPITLCRMNLGTWQGVYLCEHRDYGGRRTLVLTVWGEEK